MPALVATPRTPGSRRRAQSLSGPSRWTLFFALPAVALYCFVLVVPTVRGAGFAFTDWDGISRAIEWVGFDNFARVVTDPDSLAAFGVTLLIAGAVTVVQNTLGMLLALGVNSRIRSRNILRVLLFAPAVMTPVVTAYVWKYILAPDGVLNGVLDGIGLPALKQSWLGSPQWGLVSIMLVIVWQFSGYSMVIFLAGLQGVPTEVVEASIMDGAGPVRRFWYVVRPFLAPAITINLMLSVIGGLKLFDQVFILTGGGPGGSTNTLSTLIYKNAFTFGEFGYSIAMAIVLTLLVAIISSVQYRGLSKNEARG
ncbi:MAG: sugar ABC transporter permease [Micrococcales bacterium 70-64]|nr:sugar ABC transporter permease [Leifsonia sp.]ODU64838.1 MAG: sugar ABC transporter permease [Leifsonia sp. SCN 70-46]OJX86529.1 MAG: sugar ABC transporter permease [Micrococcales bacterium 70-64]